MRVSSNFTWCRLVILALLTLTLHAQDLKISGEVKDPSGSSVSGAKITLQGGGGHELQTTVSSNDGRFTLRPVAAGDYALVVDAGGFNPRRLALKVTRELTYVSVQLPLAPVRESVTVTTDPGRALETSRTSQTVNVVGREQIQERVRSVTAQVFNEEEGLALQRTSPTISGVFVRGLTGNKVNVFVDGVRYSNSAARGGINTFLNLLSAGNLQAIEVLRGPNSAQFGSDALGGSVQMLTLPVPVDTPQPVYSGSFSLMGSSADWSAGSDASFAAGTKHVGFTNSLSGLRSNRLRAGQGVDSHSSFLRFFGLPSDRFLDDHLPDTAFTQYGGLLKTVWAVTPESHFTSMYTRNQQDGGRRFDQTLGGDGNLVADLRNLMNDVFYVRFERRKTAVVDRFSISYSYNSQREERVNQGGNGDPNATIAHEPERTTVNGFQFGMDKHIGSHDLLFGADFYHERLTSRAFGVNPNTSAVAPRRPRVPHNARFNSGGLYLQDTLDLLKDRLQLLGALRYSAASYRVRSADSPVVSGAPLWRDDSLRVGDWTFRFGIVGHISPVVTLYGNFSKGFRAPHMTDLGTLGLTGSGFEVAAPDVEGLGAAVGSTADRNAVSTGSPVLQLT
ncbi:MAG TPA: TonB-dependent receptor, partial [Terriglobales bacterium]|nr:TonB-dependent receptor [Terriglobales bacterium]